MNPIVALAPAHVVIAGYKPYDMHTRLSASFSDKQLRVFVCVRGDSVLFGESPLHIYNSKK